MWSAHLHATALVHISADGRLMSVSTGVRRSQFWTYTQVLRWDSRTAVLCIYLAGNVKQKYADI